LAQALGVATTELAPLSAEVTLHELRWHTGLTVRELADRLNLSEYRTGAMLRAEDRLSRREAWERVLGVSGDVLDEAWANSRRRSLPPDSPPSPPTTS
jgi:hypothetical protein